MHDSSSVVVFIFPLMSSLAELPEELITTIVHSLSSDKQSLLNLCLAGNHILLAIARPLTWREVTFHVDLDEWISFDDIDWWTTRSIFHFTADQKRAKSVISPRIKFSGIYNYGQPIIGLLQESLKKLTNLNHAYLSFFEVFSTDGTPSLLEVVLQSLPSLKSVYVDGYGAGEEPIAPIELPPLKSLVTSYCSPNVAELWASARNLEVMELCGGYGARYYWENIHKLHSSRSFMGYDGETMGTGYILNEGLLHAGYFNHLRRLHIVSELDENEECLDIAHIVEFSTLCPNSLTSLEELILELPFTIPEYEVVLDGMTVPGLRRLMVKLQDTAFGYIETIFTSPRRTWERLTSLEEFWLPLEGLREAEVGIICLALSHLKNLKCLYFEENREYYADVDHMAEGVTMHLGAHLPQLDGVYWNYYSFKVLRDQEGMVKSVIKQEYQKPKWQTFSPTTAA
ncbi:hypothetical protein BT96DRAFT_1013872 [Gymnopus androsaceus JB14]|uniref:F-box domain-containing protein n=1 Tax=Gymnopus androsaceus JB14 TaxID=1447944 RepID=A0A6A4IFE2_9AGAR|nr:hypothetical protein BT96DRAFT_1013872 [Gymnopus androsaceus JB14]